MKKTVIYSVVLLFMACAGKQTASPTETAKTVIESFYQGDKDTLKKYTTDESYANFMSIQDLYSESGNSNFKVLKETSDGNTAWVKFTTSYTDEPETFKLIMADGHWKVAERDKGERAPF
ncbi:MAG: hypothetical protein ACTIJ9_00395 [Aequorivita sp.]